MKKTIARPHRPIPAPLTGAPQGSWIVEGGGSGTGGGGTGGGILGPVTAVSGSEIGTRYASDPDRLVHLTLGIVPVCPVPEPVTYFVSQDNGANWTWIGWQRMQSTGQTLHVDRLAPGQTGPWKVAAVAGSLGGDPSPIPDAGLSTLYPGVVRSAAFTVLGLSTPPAAQGITATIGSCTNVISADGFTQSGIIPPVVYTDPVGGTGFFVRITVQSIDTSGAVLGNEQAYAGTQITGGSHTTPNPLLVTYVPNLGSIRYRFYVANRNSQGDGDFSNSSTNTLQQVTYNGAATPALQYDVHVVIPPFTPISPEDVFNVTAVTASETGPKYQDEKAGLHTTIGVTVSIDHDFSKPHTVTIWFDFGTGTPVWQGWYSLTSPGQVTRIGDSTLGTDGVRKSGDIWVPANATQGNWVVYCGAGRIDQGIDPHAYTSHAFTVTPVTACLPNGTTNAQFLPDPSSSPPDPISYSKWSPGIWYWEYYCFTAKLPALAVDPNFWFMLVTVQKGATIGGVWTPAPDSEGINEDPNLNFLGRAHVQITQLPGVANNQQATIQKFGARPSTWVIPPAKKDDGSVNVYRDFRFRAYNVSRLGTDTSGSGGAGTYTLQTSCWPGGLDHFDLTPVDKNIGTLNLQAANPATITLPLTGGNGQPLTVGPEAITGDYLAPQAVHAVNMAADSVTAANDALAANAVVDGNINDVGIAKVTYGTSVFWDVVISRGIGKPVIVEQNTGIYLYGQADPSTGLSGLTSKPYVAIQNSAIGLFQGGASGGSIFLDASSNAITIYNKNGDITLPYLSVSAAGITAVNGQSSVTITGNALSFIDKANQNRLDMNSAGYQVSHGLNADGSVASNANRILVMASQLQMQCNGITRVTIDATLGTTLSDGGSNSIQLKSTGITLITTGGNETIIDSDGVRSLSGTQCVRNAGGIGVQLWAVWNETTKTGDQTKPFIGLEASTGNVYVGTNAHLLTLSGGQMTFTVTGSAATTTITNTRLTAGAGGGFAIGGNLGWPAGKADGTWISGGGTLGEIDVAGGVKIFVSGGIIVNVTGPGYP